MNMQISHRLSPRIVLLLVLFFGSGHASAQLIFTEVFLDISDNVSGECQLIIDPNAPYSAMNGDCTLREMEGLAVVRQNVKQIAGFNLGAPPRSQQVFSWLTLLVGSNAEEEFCQSFGSFGTPLEGCGNDLSITFGHVSDPDQNLIGCGTRLCNTVPSPSPPSGSVELLFCIGWDAVHYVQWGGQTVHPGDYFEVEVEKQIPPFITYWQPWYSGASGASTYSTKDSSTRFRVRTVSIWGVTIWIQFWTYENCMNGPL